MLGGVMFGVVVGVVVGALVPKEMELLLRQPIPQPVVSHVPRLGTLLVDVVVYKTVGRGIICFDGGGWLGMS
jgi:hypothetical protein